MYRQTNMILKKVKDARKARKGPLYAWSVLILGFDTSVAIMTTNARGIDSRMFAAQLAHGSNLNTHDPL